MKQYHEALPDKYNLLKTCLKDLKTRLDKNEKLIKE